MDVTANPCINKCDYIDQIYNKVINDRYGTECLNTECITLCDVLPVFPTVFTDAPEVIVEGCGTVTTITCVISLTELTTNCSPISLIEL